MAKNELTAAGFLKLVGLIAGSAVGIYILTDPYLCLIAVTVCALVLAVLLLHPEWIFSDREEAVELLTERKLND